jgi:hypothetical protein
MINGFFIPLGYAFLIIVNISFLAMFAHVAYSLLPLPRAYPSQSASLSDLFSSLVEDSDFSTRALHTGMILAWAACLEQLAVSLFDYGFPDGLMTGWWLGWLSLVLTIISLCTIWKSADWREWHVRTAGDTWTECVLVCHVIVYQRRLLILTSL